MLTLGGKQRLFFDLWLNGHVNGAEVERLRCVSNNKEFSGCNLVNLVFGDKWRFMALTDLWPLLRILVVNWPGLSVCSFSKFPHYDLKDNIIFSIY